MRSPQMIGDDWPSPGSARLPGDVGVGPFHGQLGVGGVAVFERVRASGASCATAAAGRRRRRRQRLTARRPSTTANDGEDQRDRRSMAELRGRGEGGEDGRACRKYPPFRRRRNNHFSPQSRRDVASAPDQQSPTFPPNGLPPAGTSSIMRGFPTGPVLPRISSTSADHHAEDEDPQGYQEAVPPVGHRQGDAPRRRHEPLGDAACRRSGSASSAAPRPRRRANRSASPACCAATATSKSSSEPGA